MSKRLIKKFREVVSSGQKVDFGYEYSSENIKKYLKGKKKILDVGSGPEGSYWWKYVDDGATIVGIDTLFFPSTVPSNVRIYKMDANLLPKLKDNSKLPRFYPENKKFKKEKINWGNRFDMVVANHVLEHVSSPSSVVKGVSSLIKKNGLVYAGFPESTNFTDVFYHLIHAEGGGHIQKLTKESVNKIFKKNGFSLVECNMWPDDWLWFEKLYDYKGRGIEYITQDEIKYLADVFRKELTMKKGYFYGWEMVFKKT